MQTADLCLLHTPSLLYKLLISRLFSHNLIPIPGFYFQSPSLRLPSLLALHIWNPCKFCSSQSCFSTFWKIISLIFIVHLKSLPLLGFPKFHNSNVEHPSSISHLKPLLLFLEFDFSLSLSSFSNKNYSSALQNSQFTTEFHENYDLGLQGSYSLEVLFRKKLPFLDIPHF